MFSRAFLAVPMAAGVLALTAAPASASIIPLTYADDGANITAALGTQITVSLQPQSAYGLKYIWSLPSPSNTLVLQKLPGSSSPRGGVVGTFKASGAGVGQITAQRTCIATTPGVQCPAFVTPWQATISVP
jgi:hypothetical protein